jgi:chromosome partitioning protein
MEVSMIVVVGGTKGGTGKSTIVTNLATVDIHQGHDSLLLDTDKQGSASAWAAVREESNEDLPRVPTMQKFGGVSLTNELKALAGKYQNIFVDAGGYDSEELRASIIICDVLLIPLRPAQFDVWTLPRIIELISQAQVFNASVQPLFVINGAHTSPNVREADDLMNLAAEVEGMRFAKTVIHNRRAFVKAAASGLSVSELKRNDKDAKAAQEITELYQEITYV